MDARSAPVSFAQARLWLHDQLFPGESLYNELSVLRFAGALDRDALERTLDELVRRHASLRTRFVVVDGAPVQAVSPPHRLELAVEDLRGDARGPRAAARERALAEGREPFDLARGPLVRARLLVVDEDEQWLALTIHHIVTDGWSGEVLLRELVTLYAAFAQRLPSPLPEPSMQYADHAIGQRDAARGEAFAASVGYWKRTLDGVVPLELPTDRTRPAVANHAGARVAFDVDAELAGALRSLARSHRATLFMTLGAALQVLLHRVSGQDDIAIGVPIASRKRADLEPLVGFFVNMVVVRGNLGGAPRFADVLDRVRARTLDAFEHQDVPFERLVLELAPQRDASRNPLFQVSFALHPARSVARFDLPGLTIERLDDLVNVGAKFDLGVTLLDTGAALRGTIDFATALFDAATVERLARMFVALLRSVVAAPNESIGRLPLHDAAERARRIAEGDALRPAPSAARVDDRVARHAALHPDAIAIDDETGTMTYAELDARANRLAHAIRAAAAPRRVGLALERGRDLVVAMLATLKAGAAYVPLDTAHPAERLRAVLDDASVALVVGEARSAARLPADGPPLLAVDRDAALVASMPASPPPRADADDVACVMSTSGSTGRPKSVEITHAAIVNLVVDNAYARLGDDDVVAHLAHPAFDAVTFEVWGALANGARLVPIARDTALAPRALATTLKARGVTAIFVTTALFNAIAREAPDAFARCRHVLFGGEAVEPRWVREVLRAAPQRLVHVYGPTETTTFATWHEVDASEAAHDTIPIGRPIDGAEVHVLDREGEPAPVGIPGEIYIGGVGLAHGYLGNAASRVERFVDHPLRAGSQARLFRTGDRARVRADGAIEFLGRQDRQVKVRGHRIELDEVQSALAALPYVRHALVLLRGDTSDTRRLVAWLVPADASAPPPTSLRRDLRQRLPETMLPSATVWVPSLPLTANGKVDIRALPEPGADVRTGMPTPPRDMLEGLLARLWEDLLGIRGIGVHDRFFEIGGHSLLAARLVDAIERTTGHKVPLTALFGDDTIDGLARRLREGAKHDAPVVDVHPQGTRAPFVFLHGDFQAGGFYSGALARALGPDQPTLIVHPHGLAGEPVPDTIEAMAADRVRAVRMRRPHGPYVVGGHCNGALVAFEMARQMIAAGDDILAVVLIESRAPAPGAGPADRPGAYVKFNDRGEPVLLAARDRLSDIELRYTRAIDAYAGGPCDGHLVVVQAQEWRAPALDAGWARFAASWEGHVVAGGHVTMITRHLDELARTLREAIARREPRTSV